MNKYFVYEMEKWKIQRESESSQEYEYRIKKLVDELEI